METSALLKEIKGYLDYVCAKTIFRGMLLGKEYQYRHLVQNIQAKIGHSNLDHQLQVVRTYVKDLVDDITKNSDKTDTWPFSQVMMTTNLTGKMKNVLGELERAADDLVGESERTLGEVGREKETEEIIDQIMYFCGSSSPATGVPVITITGLVGMGKTVLAQLVRDNIKVKQKVVMPVWIDISGRTIDGDKIAKDVIGYCKKEPKADNSNIFVILDDVREEIMDRHLEAFQHKLKEADLHVGAIMITTHSSRVVRNIAVSPVKLYVLPGLNEEESLCLFQRIVGLVAGDKYVFVSSLAEDVRRKIVGQCRGVPLAIVIMAKFLYACPSPSRLTQFMKEDFLSKLAQLYDYQIPHKVCFAYCSVFPRDYLIDAERLIHLWMAEGFVNSSNPSTSSEPDREAIGRGYLRDLVDRFIFQDVKEDEFGVVRSCRMHPLMHDIARFMANRKDNINGNGQNFLPASFDLSTDFPGGIQETLFAKGNKLKSMFFFATTAGSRLPLQMEMSKAVLEIIFKRFKRLCVLDLRGLRIKRVPNSIGKLSDLVYLDLSQNDMMKLPSSITKLSNLQTLKLSRCYSLEELPNNFEKLTKLKHLDLEGCVGLTRMPRNMSKLSSLRTLSTFVASKNDATGGLQQFASVTNLRSEHLEILHMERVQSFPSCLDQNESYIERLTLRWDLGVHHRRLLFTLPRHLRVLILVGYQYYSPFHWFVPLEFIVKLSLSDCQGCEFLFDSWHLPKLKILQLLRLENLEFVEQDFETNETLYSKLEELIISDCPKLKSWWAMEVMEYRRPFFANISKLHVHHCPLLTSMPLYPHLDQELVLVGSSFKPLLDSITYATDARGFFKLKSMVVSSVTFNPLQIRHIQNFNHLENLSACFKHMSSLQRLTIENCEEIDLDGKSNQWEGLESLRFLTVRTIPILSTFSFGGNLTTLRELTLHNCLGLTSISDNIDKVTSLRRLSISRCNKLESLPITMKDLKSLNTLIILDCILLLPRCQPETGHDWPQIRHIKHIQVK